MSRHDLASGREWTSGQVKLFVQRAKKRHAHAWSLIPSLRDAILAEEYARVTSGIGGDPSLAFSRQGLRFLWQDMLAEAGLLGEVRP